MNDPVWTSNVVEYSAKLVLEARNIEVVICAKPRHELLDGGFEKIDSFVLPLRGGNTSRTVTVYKANRDIRMPAKVIRDMAANDARSNFLTSASSYIGDTVDAQRLDMEVSSFAIAVSVLI